MAKAPRGPCQKQPPMTTSTALRPAVRAALSGLIDYAGLFPPAELSLDAAQREYESARAGRHVWMLGRFIARARQLPAASAAFAGPFSVIVEPGRDALREVATCRASGASIETLEIPLQRNIPADEIADAIGKLDGDIAATGLHDLPIFLEVPRTERWPDLLSPAMETLARAGLGAKLRCGGVVAEAFPTVDEVVEFIAAANQAAVPFKATAGLHHPIRHRDPTTGFMMHGFLNLLGAVALAPYSDRQTLRRIVAEEEPGAFSFDNAAFVWRAERVEIAELKAERREHFIAYGSCSFSEPVEDLIALGILPPQ